MARLNYKIHFLIFLWFHCFIGLVSCSERSPFGSDEKTYRECPTTWTSFKSKCFRLGQFKATAEKASEACKNFENIYGATLATIHSVEENDFIKFYILKTQPDGQHDWVRIGGYRTVANPNWQWEDGTEFNYTNWHCDSPTPNWTKRNSLYISTAENYVTINQGGFGKWHDSFGVNRHDFICQIRLTSQGSGAGLALCNSKILLLFVINTFLYKML